MKPSYRIRITFKVAIDLEGIFEYIAQDSPVQVSRQIEHILSAIEGLGYFSGSPGGDREKDQKNASHAVASCR